MIPSLVGHVKFLDSTPGSVYLVMVSPLGTYQQVNHPILQFMTRMYDLDIYNHYVLIGIIILYSRK